MINNKRSYTEYNITSPTTDFAIGFENYGVGAKDIIEVTLNGVLVESLGHTVRLKNAQVLEVTPAIKAGTVRLQRVTAIDSSFHKFTAGALFTAKSMDENFEQIRHSQQEVKDGFLQAVLKQAAQFNEYKQIITAQVNTSLTAVNQAVQAFSGRVGALEGSVTGIIRDLYQFGDKAAQYTKDAVKTAITDAQVNIGFITIDSFELGATITQRNQALRQAADGKLYRWAGDLPKTVPAGSTPDNSGGVGTDAWLEVSDTALRQEILTGGLITDTIVTMTKKDGVGAVERTLRDINSEEYNLRDFGAVGDGVTDDTVAIKNAINAAIKTGKPLYIPATSETYRYRVRSLSFDFAELSNNKSLIIYGAGEASCFKAFDGEINQRWCQSFRFAPKTGITVDSILIKDIKVDNNARGSTPPPADSPYAYEQSAAIAVGVEEGAHVESVTFDNVAINDPAADGFNTSSMGGTIGTLRYLNVIERNRTRVRSSILDSFSAKITIIVNPLVSHIETEATRAPTGGSATVQIQGGRVEVLDIMAKSEEDDVKYIISDLIVTRACYLSKLKDVTIDGGQLVLSSTRQNFPYLANAIFRNLTIKHPYNEVTGGVTSLNFLRRVEQNSYIEFDNVSFEIDYDGLLPLSHTSALISNTGGTAVPNDKAKNHIVVIKDSSFDERAYQSVFAYRMGTVHLINNKYGGVGSAISWSTGGADYVTILRIDGGDFSGVAGTALSFGGDPQLTHKLTMTGLWVGDNSNTFTLVGGALSKFAPYIENSRVIELNTDLPTIALSKDTFRNADISQNVGDVMEYLCVKGSITAPEFVCKTQFGIASYETDTDSLPILPVYSKLAQAFDTTTSTLKTWTGDSWV